MWVFVTLMKSLYKSPLYTTYQEVRKVETLKFSKSRSKFLPIQPMRIQEQIEKNQHSVVGAIVQILFEAIEQSSLHKSF